MIDATNLPALASFFPTPTHPDQIVDQFDQLHLAAPHLTNTANLAHHFDKQQVLQDQMQKSASAPAPLAAPPQSQPQGQPLPAPQTASAAPLGPATVGSSTGGAGGAGLPANWTDSTSFSPTESLASPQALAPMPSQAAPAPLPVVQPTQSDLDRQQQYDKITKPDTGLHNRENTGTSGINQIHNPWARIPLQIVDALGRQMAPQIEQAIPGTSGHHNALVAQAEKEREADQQVMSEQQKRQEEAAQQVYEQSRPELAALTAENTALKNQRDYEVKQELAEIAKGKLDEKTKADFYKLGIDPVTHEAIPLEKMPPQQRATVLLTQARAAQANAQAEYDEARAKGVPQEIENKRKALEVANMHWEIANQRAQQTFDVQYKGIWPGQAQGGEPPAGVPLGPNNKPLPLKVANINEPTTEMRNQAGQAQAVIQSGGDLTKWIDAHRDSLGKVSDYWKDFVSNSPIADPVVSEFYNRIMSYAALQPKLHAMRSADLVKAIEHQLGGATKNPDAIIAAINAIGGTAEIIKGVGTPRVSQGGGQAGGGAQPNVVDLEFDGKGNLVPKKK